MRRADVAPTKSNLLRLKEGFQFVTSGHELLDQKRQVLLEELLDLARDAAQLRRDAEAALSTAYAAYREAAVAVGDAALAAAALSPAGSVGVNLRERSVMGVVVPLLELVATARPQPVCAPQMTPMAASQARRQLWEALPMLVRLAEVEVSCRRLAAELLRTQRKVNALEHVFIPEYRDTIRFIENSLEEKEREALFHLKLLKQRRVAADGEVSDD